MAFLTNGACRIYTPTSGPPLSPKFGQGAGGSTTAIAVVGYSLIIYLILFQIIRKIWVFSPLKKPRALPKPMPTLTQFFFYQLIEHLSKGVFTWLMLILHYHTLKLHKKIAQNFFTLYWNYPNICFCS